jgi:hypothetical protein
MNLDDIEQVEAEHGVRIYRKVIQVSLSCETCGFKFDNKFESCSHAEKYGHTLNGTSITELKLVRYDLDERN